MTWISTNEKTGQRVPRIDARHAKCGVGQTSKRELGGLQESRNGWWLQKRDSEREAEKRGF